MTSPLAANIYPEQHHTLRAFLLAPLVVPVLWALFLGLRSTAGPLEMLELVVCVVIYSVPGIYGPPLLVGLPVYLMIRRYGQLKAWHSVVTATVLGAVVMPAVGPPIADIAGIGAVLGFAAGSSFWVLWRPRT